MRRLECSNPGLRLSSFCTEALLLEVAQRWALANSVIENSHTLRGNSKWWAARRQNTDAGRLQHMNDFYQPELFIRKVN